MNALASTWQTFFSCNGPRKMVCVGLNYRPVLPHIVPRDEITNPHRLRVILRVNGTVLQHGNTRDLIFEVPTLITYISDVMTLEPGDLILTGTPPGVGYFRDPPVSLRPGNTVEIEVESVGTLTNPVVDEQDR